MANKSFFILSVCALITTDAFATAVQYQIANKCAPQILSGLPAREDTSLSSSGMYDQGPQDMDMSWVVVDGSLKRILAYGISACGPDYYNADSEWVDDSDFRDNYLYGTCYGCWCKIVSPFMSTGWYSAAHSWDSSGSQPNGCARACASDWQNIYYYSLSYSGLLPQDSTSRCTTGVSTNTADIVLANSNGNCPQGYTKVNGNYPHDTSQTILCPGADDYSCLLPRFGDTVGTYSHIMECTE